MSVTGYSEPARAAWLSWWRARTPEARARFRAMQDQPAQLVTHDLHVDVDGTPASVERHAEGFTGRLPEFVLYDDPDSEKETPDG